jgi:hypothetical protein
MPTKSKDPVVGHKIVEMRPMTTEEMKKEGWYDKAPTVLVLSNGTKLYASRDDEGNGAGALFATTKDGSQLGFYTSVV